MSAKQSGQVWELDLEHPLQSVLLALADHADHNGENVYPSIALIAWKTGYSERAVQYILRKLEKAELILPVSSQEGGRGRTNEYILQLQNGKKKEPFKSDRNKKKGAKSAPFPKDPGQKNGANSAPIKSERVQNDSEKGCNPEQERVQNDPLKGAITIAPESITVFEPSKEPKDGDSEKSESPSLEDLRKEKKKTQEPASVHSPPAVGAVDRLKNFFRSKCEEIRKVTPIMNGAKEGALLKRRLEAGFLESEIEQLIIWFFKSPESYKFGPSLSVCLCEIVMNKWLSFRPRKESENGKAVHRVDVEPDPEQVDRIRSEAREIREAIGKPNAAEIIKRISEKYQT